MTSFDYHVMGQLAAEYGEPVKALRERWGMGRFTGEHRDGEMLTF